MDKIDLILFRSLQTYFNILKGTGYLKDKDVLKIVTLIGIQYIIHNFLEYISETDYNKLYRLLLCLEDGCLIANFYVGDGDLLLHPISRDFALRITEDSFLRSTEDALFRTKQ